MIKEMVMATGAKVSSLFLSGKPHDQGRVPTHLVMADSAVGSLSIRRKALKKCLS